MALLSLSLQAQYDDAGNRVFDGRLLVYRAGTTTPAPAYADAGFGSRLRNPVPSRGNGTWPLIYLPPGSYRVRITDPDGYVYDEIEDLTIAAPSSGNGGGGGSVDANRLAQTGDIKDRYDTGTHPGWLRMDGRTVGSSTSAASSRANDDTQALFLHLWNKDGSLAVSGGRGPNAQSDWLAGKTIALPDQAGRLRVGLDDLGAGNKGRLNGGLFAFGNAVTLGSYGGEASHVQTLAELASHPHPVSASMDGQGGHYHVGIVDPAGDHAHGVTYNRFFNFQQGGQSSVTVNVGAGGDIGQTNPAGGHAHSYMTNAVGPHAHTITASTASAGNSVAMNWLPPFLLVSTYIKL